MPFTAREFDFVVRKFGFALREGSHLIAVLQIDGLPEVRTVRSRQTGDLPRWRSILRQMHLTEDEFREAHRCTLSREQYYELLRRRIPLA